MIAPGVTRRLNGQFTRPPRCCRKQREMSGFTDCERDVLRLVGLRMSNAEITAAMYIVVGTAKTHVARPWPSWAPGTGYSRPWPSETKTGKFP